MKKTVYLLTALMVAVTIVLPSVRTSLVSEPAKVEVSLPAGEQELFPSDSRSEISRDVFTGVYGEEYIPGAAELEKLLSVPTSALSGVTFTSEPVGGTITYLGRPVEVFDYVAREGIPYLSFKFGSEENISVSLLPNCADAVPTMLTVKKTDSPGYRPVLKPGEILTIKNISAAGSISAYDPEGGTLSFSVRTAPQKGVLTSVGSGLVYVPYKDATGTDSAVICAVNESGNYSEDVALSITIEDSKDNFAFADMGSSPSHYAAIKLRQAGRIGGEQVGETWFFHPTREVTNGEFLVMILSALGEDGNLSPTVSTGLNKDSEIPDWLKPYVAKAITLGIIKEKTFDVNDVPTRAEAVLLIDRALRKSPVRNYNLTLEDVGEIPSWALESYMKLAKYGMLGLYDNRAYPNKSLNRDYAAELIWGLFRNISR